MKKLTAMLLCLIIVVSLCSCGEKAPSYDGECTLKVTCALLEDHMDTFDSSKESVIPEDYVIFSNEKAGFNTGDTVCDVLLRELKDAKVQIDYEDSELYGGAYIKGIGNIYEKDCGDLSGWMFTVNGKVPSVGCSQKEVSDGDNIEFVYICDYNTDLVDFEFDMA